MLVVGWLLPSETPQEKKPPTIQAYLNSMYIMCDYSIATAQEQQTLSMLSLELLRRVVRHYYSSTYLLLKRDYPEPKQKIFPWAP